MAEPANVLRAINLMLQSRQDKRRDDIAFALEGLKLSQREAVAKQEMDIKKQTLELAKQEFAEKKKQTFITNIAAIQGPILAERNAQYNSGYASFFAPMIRPHVKSYDEESGMISEWRGADKKGGNDFITALEKRFGDRAQAEKVFSLIEAYDKNPTNTASLIALVDTWETYTGHLIPDFNDASELNIQYQILNKEREDIQIGDFDFNLLEEYYSQKELAELEALRKKKYEEEMKKQGFVWNEEEQKWLKPEPEIIKEPVQEDIEYDKLSAVQLEDKLVKTDMAGNIIPLEGDERMAVLGKMLEDFDEDIDGWNPENKLFKLSSEFIEDSKHADGSSAWGAIPATFSSADKAGIYYSRLDDVEKKYDLNEAAIADINKKIQSGLTEEGFQNTPEYDSLRTERAQRRISNEALSYAMNYLENEAESYRGERRGERADVAFGGIKKSIDYLSPLNPIFGEGHPEYELKWSDEHKGYRVFVGDDVATDRGFGGKQFIPDIANIAHGVGRWAHTFWEDVFDYEKPTED